MIINYVGVINTECELGSHLNGRIEVCTPEVVAYGLYNVEADHFLKTTEIEDYFKSLNIEFISKNIIHFMGLVKGVGEERLYKIYESICQDKEIDIYIQPHRFKFGRNTEERKTLNRLFIDQFYAKGGLLEQVKKIDKKYKNY